MKFNQKGEGRGGAIFGILVLATILYFAWKIIPVAINVYAYADAVADKSKYFSGRSLETLRGELYREAQKEQLPVEEEDIEIEKISNQLHVEVTYTVQIVFPGYTWNWPQHVVYDAPVF